jgi:hypothetical protein
LRWSIQCGNASRWAWPEAYSVISLSIAIPRSSSHPNARQLKGATVGARSSAWISAKNPEQLGEQLALLLDGATARRVLHTQTFRNHPFFVVSVVNVGQRALTIREVEWEVDPKYKFTLEVFRHSKGDDLPAKVEPDEELRIVFDSDAAAMALAPSQRQASAIYVRDASGKRSWRIDVTQTMRDEAEEKSSEQQSWNNLVSNHSSRPSSDCTLDQELDDASVDFKDVSVVVKRIGAPKGVLGEDEVAASSPSAESRMNMSEFAGSRPPPSSSPLRSRPCSSAAWSGRAPSAPQRETSSSTPSQPCTIESASSKVIAASGRSGSRERRREAF